MIYSTRELHGAMLEYALAMAKGMPNEYFDKLYAQLSDKDCVRPDAMTTVSFIDDYIDYMYRHANGTWLASATVSDKYTSPKYSPHFPNCSAVATDGVTLAQAVNRCFVLYKLGEAVDIPERFATL